MMRGLTLILLLSAVVVLEGSRMEMPSFAVVGEKVEIECKFDHEKKDIEHIQWYKDNQLFYTVSSKNDPPVRKVDLPGLDVDIDQSQEDKLVIQSVTSNSAGLYTCELKKEEGMARMSGTLTIFAAQADKE